MGSLYRVEWIFGFGDVHLHLSVASFGFFFKLICFFSRCFTLPQFTILFASILSARHIFFRLLPQKRKVLARVLIYQVFKSFWFFLCWILSNKEIKMPLKKPTQSHQKRQISRNATPPFNGNVWLKCDFCVQWQHLSFSVDSANNTFRLKIVLFFCFLSFFFSVCCSFPIVHCALQNVVSHQTHGGWRLIFGFVCFTLLADGSPRWGGKRKCAQNKTIIEHKLCFEYLSSSSISHLACLWFVFENCGGIFACTITDLLKWRKNSVWRGLSK